MIRLCGHNTTNRLTSVIDREFVTSAKKLANFNEFSEIKKNRKKFVKCPSVGLSRVPVGYPGNKLPW